MSPKSAKNKVKHDYDFFVFETIIRTLVDENINTLQETATKDRKSIVQTHHAVKDM